jgi:FkbM family methyltransferase
MQVHEQTIFNRIGKTLAEPLSLVVANSRTEGFARLMEAYWCILLGKGAGTGWAIEAEINAAKSVINHSSPIIFDVGANNGEWSLLLHRVYPQSRIFLFEPQPACQKIIENKNIPNSLLIPKAVSSSAEHSVKFYASGDTSGIASLHQRRDSYFNDKDFTLINVNTVTIDDFVREHNLARVDFMKMDIEGHELDALKGAIESLESRVIKALSF